MTTAGGWGVVTADAITAHRDLELATLPDDLREAIDEMLPPRWSRNNPVDLAGGETRDTIPEVLRLIAEHPDVDAVIHLGLGIQSNQARMLREGGFFGTDGDDDARHPAHRRLPRTPGRPLRDRGSRDLERHGQAHPHRHGAGRGLPGQRGSGRGQGRRTALLSLGRPSGDRARPSRAAGPVPASGGL